MPDIWIVGFESQDQAEKVRLVVDVVMRDRGIAADAITTIISANARFCNNSHRAPFLVVRDTDIPRAVSIAEELHKIMNHDVEIQRIDGFFAGAL